jgi:hypothetical protein
MRGEGLFPAGHEATVAQSSEKNKRSPCPHKTSNTLQANNLLKINLEWALSYEWEFYEFVLFLSAG